MAFFGAGGRGGASGLSAHPWLVQEGVVYCHSWPRARQKTPNESKLQREVTNSSRGQEGLWGGGSGAEGCGASLRRCHVQGPLSRGSPQGDSGSCSELGFLSRCHHPGTRHGREKTPTFCVSKLWKTTLSLVASAWPGAAGLGHWCHPRVLFLIPTSLKIHSELGDRGRIRVHSASPSLPPEPLGPGGCSAAFSWLQASGEQLFLWLQPGLPLPQHPPALPALLPRPRRLFL